MTAYLQSLCMLSENVRGIYGARLVHFDVLVKKEMQQVDLYKR